MAVANCFHFMFVLNSPFLLTVLMVRSSAISIKVILVIFIILVDLHPSQIWLHVNDKLYKSISIKK